MSNKKDISSFLEKINNPKDLKKLKEKQLHKVCDEVRSFMIDKVSNDQGLFLYSKSFLLSFQMNTL